MTRTQSRPTKTAPGLLLLCACLSLAACSSLMPGPPAYTGADTVDAVPAQAFVGTWRLVALNPVDDEEIPERTLTYEADGTFSGMIMPTDDMKSMTGEEPIRMSGTWRVEAGELVHDTSELDIPGDDLISRMSAKVMRSRPPVVSRGNVYERSADRIVIVTEDGYANAFERL